MSAGKLKDRITILNYTDVSDGGGGFSRTWVPGETVWGNFTPLKAEERVAASKEVMDLEAVAIVRYPSSISSSNRIRLNSIDYEVTGIVNIKNENRYLEISLKKVVNES